MIRHAQGDSFLLITQHDHALASGELARHIGNAMFAPPSPFEETIAGISLHDAGWPIHDDEAPTLNKKGLPLHVLESPMDLATRVWSESVRRASEKHAYSGLLVSLHVTALSNYAQTQQTPFAHERSRTPAEHFLLNKFQQKQFEIQEDLRRQLKMRIDLPLNNGLAEPGVDAAEDLLLFNYHLLKTMDRVSLDACCSEDLFKEIDTVYPRPGELPVKLKVTHTGPGSMELSPWPFAVERIELKLPCRRVPAKSYETDEAFRETYRAAPTESFSLRIAAF